jgi:glycosyltransferase involved in cell wall biosynthesis
MKRIGMDCRIVVILTTKNREGLLLNRSLPSIKDQHLQPSYIIIINDGEPFQEMIYKKILSILTPIKTLIMMNNRKAGYSGAINSGLNHLRNMNYDGFIALIDDDDEWDPNHLEENMKVALQEKANIIISGLKYIKNGFEKPREIISDIKYQDFIVGNPGWQGSNTFVHSSILFSVDGFNEDLPSMNDRDIAIRLLKRRDSIVAYTGIWTAKWYADKDRKSLSTPRSIEKISGLRTFWKIYKDEMTGDQKKQYFERAEHFFGFTMKEIIDQ